jgi:hypothetical protein
MGGHKNEDKSGAAAVAPITGWQTQGPEYSHRHALGPAKTLGVFLFFLWVSLTWTAQDDTV